MNKFLIYSLLTLTFVASVFAGKPHKVVFYNVENLFDTINDPEVIDEEFLPDGAKRWNTAKYTKKIGNLERVFFDIASIDKNYPAVIGLAEVENRGVLEDIIATPKMRPGNYRIAHFDSPDKRGVDVAFLYRPDVFKLKGSKAVKEIFPTRPEFRTRDIVTMWGTIDGEDFVFMVAHWPSRLGGKEQSEYLRVAVGTQMRAMADSILAENPATKIIMMGDFNDDPTDKSVATALGAKAKRSELKEGDLYNPFINMLKAGLGTLAYNDMWNIFDNMVVSQNLVNGDKNKLQLQPAAKSKFDGNIFKQSYMIQQEGQYKGYPLRTFVGNNFQGGFSDHFPVYIYIGK
jgi:predicted extracellular nuclease